jgi:tripartite ATP-independent transporter DctM subunit
VAAGGTLGILIPPSLVFILYGVLAEQSIGQLFMAGILPGILSAGLYIVTIAVLVRFNPRMGPPASRFPFRERIRALKQVWGALGLFLLIVGGIYGGFFTPTEAAAVGAFGTFLLVLLKGRFSFKQLSACLAGTARNTAMLVLIFIGATLFNYFLALTRLPSDLVGWVAASSISPAMTLAAILLIYLLLGCIMDSGSMIILTMPLVFPLVQQCGFHPIWFGVIVVVMAEIGSITPPVGINVFIVQASARDVPLPRVFAGVLPFLAADLVRLVILILIPAISLFLPDLLASSGR